MMTQPFLLHWTNETSGRLARYIVDFINRHPLDAQAVHGLKIYFSYWADYPGWLLPDDQLYKLENLRSSILKAETREDLEKWLDDALKMGIDPL